MSTLEEINREELEQEMHDIWVELGRDATNMYLKDKTEEKLKEDLLKLRAVRMALTILKNDDNATGLAVHLLADAFGERTVVPEDEHEREGEAES